MKQPIPPMAMRCKEAYFDSYASEMLCKRNSEPCRIACWKCDKSKAE